jgi:hypothetical protein
MSQHWYRIERRDTNGRVRDWVEVGRCRTCGRGVDRAFPADYREVDGSLYCRECNVSVAVLRPSRPAGTQ